MSSTEKDLELKLRTMRYLWHTGCLVRRNVDLVEYDYEKSRVYTDIDVLGIKLDESLEAYFIVCDCKSGIKVKTAERLFWLSGVMSYFGASEGLFVRNQVMSTKYVELSKRLNILPISSSELSYFERIYKIPDMFYGPFCEEQELAEYVFSELKKHDRSVYDYILKRYWKDHPPQQITTLVASCRRISAVHRLENYQKAFLLAYALSHLSLSILRLSRVVLNVPNNQKEVLAKQELLGGTMSFSERQKLLEGFYGFMTKEISERYKQKYPLSRKAFVESLSPEYSKYLADLVIRLCEDPKSSLYIPQILDLLAFEKILNDRAVDLGKMLPSRLGLYSLKPLKDFLVFAERGGLTNANFQKLSKEYLSSLENEENNDIA